MGLPGASSTPAEERGNYVDTTGNLPRVKPLQLAIAPGLIGLPQNAQELAIFHILDGGNPELKKLCIVGFAESSRNLAPSAGDEYEFWGMNHLYPYVDRPWSRWFDLHLVEDMPKLNFWGAKVNGKATYKEFLETAPFPIYMHEEFPQFPPSRRYPIEIAKNVFGDGAPDELRGYFTNSIAYCVALAMLEGYRHIEIFGVDMRHDEEWHWQRSNCEFYLGWARALGITIVIPPQSALLSQAYQYGYERDLPTDLTEIRNFLIGEVPRLEKAFKEAEQRNFEDIRLMCHADGARQWVDMLLFRLEQKRRGGTF